MSTYNDSLSLLDRIRLDNGIEKLKDTFHDLVNSNKEKAIHLVNDENMQFPSLFMLKSEIKKHDLFTHLNVRNKCALEIVSEILTRNNSESASLSNIHNKENYPVLKWIFDTGYKYDGFNDQYDEVLETTAIILIKLHNDKTCLRPIEEMIFDRYKKGFLIYDLVWAFFEASDAESLILIANRLRSSSLREVELARKLLNFIPCIGADNKENNMKQYKSCLKWISQNRDFLYYTGESLLQGSNPCRYAVSLESKYLQSPITNDHGKTLRLLSDKESTLLDNFSELDNESKLLLSDCSSILYQKNKNLWKKWHNYPTLKQLEIARQISEG